MLSVCLVVALCFFCLHVSPASAAEERVSKSVAESSSYDDDDDLYQEGRSASDLYELSRSASDLYHEGRSASSSVDYGLFQSAAIGLGALGLLGLGYKTIGGLYGTSKLTGASAAEVRGASLLGVGDFDLGSPRFFPEGWGMDQCGEMAVCDAHARYNEYGILALPIVMFFPG